VDGSKQQTYSLCSTSVQCVGEQKSNRSFPKLFCIWVTKCLVTERDMGS